VAATRRYADRPGAVEASFGAGGAYVDAVAALRTGQMRALDVSDDVFELAFHACWLEHAFNERNTAAPGDSAPFRAIVQHLALTHGG